MKRLLFASLLTAAIVYAQANGGSSCKADKTGTTKTKKAAGPLPVPPKRRNATTITESTHKSGSTGGDDSPTAKTKKGGRKAADVDKPGKKGKGTKSTQPPKLPDKDGRK